jgi:hypothetical protein
MLSYLRGILHEFRRCTPENQNWTCASWVRCLDTVWKVDFPELISKALALYCNRICHLSEWSISFTPQKKNLSYDSCQYLMFSVFRWNCSVCFCNVWDSCHYKISSWSWCRSKGCRKDGVTSTWCCNGWYAPPLDPHPPGSTVVPGHLEARWEN